MSYQVLARKWRPRFFDEMVGQEHVLRALINALNEGRLHHAYLFTGTRGVGKTTIARILAKCLNCEQGVSARPCGECSSCREIAEGRFVDLIEVDAASRTRVEDTRELLDNVQYAPTRGRFKVYLIDEVHMLSTHSFNALLKTLEEPPEHVKFLLATTDPQKLPVTILSRCLQFSLKNMTPERIVGYLGKVLQAESVPYDEPALWSLGRAAQGSMRDALSLTDQAIAFGEGEVHESQVNSMLGSMDRGRLFRLAEVMAKADASEILAETASMAEHSPDYDEILQGLLHIWHRASLAQVVPDAIDNAEGDREAILQLSMAMPAEDLQLCYQIALQGRQDLAMAPEPRQGFEMILLRMLAFRPAPDVVPELDLVSALEKKKPLTTVPSETNVDPEIGLNTESKTEIAVDDAQGIPVAEAAAAESVISEPFASDSVASEPVALQASETEQPFPQASASHAVPVQDPSDDVEAADAGVNSYSDVANTEEKDSTEADHAEDHVHSVDDVIEAANSEITSLEATKPESVEPEPVPSADVPAEGTQDRRDGSLADLMDNPVQAVETDVSSQEREQPFTDVSEAGGVSSVDELPELAPHTWHMWVDHLALAGLPMAIARNSALIKRDDTSGVAVLEFDVDPAQGALYNDTQRERITTALRELLPGVTLIMTLTATRGETPEQRRQRLLADALYSARQAIDSDPLVDQIINELGGQIIEDTVRPNT
jgi:DNA polymerase-3 subunit gamma/tau